MSFHKIVLDSHLRNIRVFRKIPNELDEYIIPDQISLTSNVEIEDSLGGSVSILYPNSYTFPKDLDRFIGKEIKCQLTDGSQITGKFVGFEDSFGKDISFEFGAVEKKNTDVKGAAVIPTTPVSSKRIVLDSTKCHSEKLTKQLPNGLISIAVSHIQSYFPVDFEISDKSTKIQFNDYKSRDVIVSYDLPFSNDSFASGYFNHFIRGVKLSDIYSDPKLESNIPITFKTVFYWVPIWDIQDDNVTLSLISDDGKETFTVKNFQCTKNYLTQIVVNEFTSSVTRAVLVSPLGGIRISLFFQNNSKFILSNVSNINFGPVKGLNGFGFNDVVKMFNQVKPEKIGVISFNFENSKIKVYKDIAHQPLWDTKSRESTITNIKISNIFTLVDTETSSKIKFQFVNATSQSTKYIVNLGNTSHEQNGTISSNGKEIDQSLYLFDSSPLSISQFQITHSQKKTFMTHHKFPVILINYLEEKGIRLQYNKDKFETYDLSHLDRNTQDTIFKLMSSLNLEEKTSNYFNRNTETSISNSLFSESNFKKSPASFYNNNTNVGLFGSSIGSFSDNSQPQQQSSGLFGSASPFGTQQQQPQSSFGLFGQQQPQQQSSGLFGSASPFGTQQQQQPQSSSGLFGQQQQPQSSTTLFGSASPFGQQQQQQQPQSSSGLFGQQKPQSTTGSASLNQATTPTPTPQATSVFGSTTPAKPSSFGFGSQTVSTSPSSFGFGSQTVSTSPSSFTFGGQGNNDNDSQSSDTESISSFVSIPSSSPPPVVTHQPDIKLVSQTEFETKSFEELKLEHNNLNK